MISKKEGVIVIPTLVNFISSQTKENWHLVDSVDQTTPSGERWVATMRGIAELLLERTKSFSFTHPTRGERAICRVSGFPCKFVIIDSAIGDIDFELTKLVGFMVDKAVRTGTAVSGSKLQELSHKPDALSKVYTFDGQWYALGEQFVLRKEDWRQVRTAELLFLYGQGEHGYQQIEMSSDQRDLIAAMVEELKRLARAIGA